MSGVFSARRAGQIVLRYDPNAREGWKRMCRSIKQLRRSEPPTEDEIHAAALQYIRKVSGYRAPSRANGPAFEAAVDEVAQATARLLRQLSRGRPRQPEESGL